MTGFRKLVEKVEKAPVEQVPAVDKRLELGGFKPTPSSELTEDDERVADRVAERHGATGEPVGRVQLTRNKSVQDRMFVQGPLATLNRFRTFCNEKGVPLHKGLEMLLDRYER